LFYLLLSSPSPLHPPALHSFPTRRSSDLAPADPRHPGSLLPTSAGSRARAVVRQGNQAPAHVGTTRALTVALRPAHCVHSRLPEDRKSTRLNSSHVSISYAVFCLKKKKKA